MRRLLFLPLLAGTLAANAQTVSDFESLTLATADTYYVNHSDKGVDVGFEDGLAYFPCVYDSSMYGWWWSKGFTYSNMTDTVTPGFINMYAARPGKGANNSANYVVAWDVSNVVYLRGDAIGKPVQGMYVTNSNYAYKSMKEGDDYTDPFDATNKGWFKITVYGYDSGQLKQDSVAFYLADFRSADPADHFIIDTWEWLDLSALGGVDSLLFTISSSDIMQPTYFCLDDFTTHEDYTPDPGAVSQQSAYIAKVYPNPAAEKLYVETGIPVTGQIRVTDITGKLHARYEINGAVTEINTAALVPGMYMLMLQTEGKIATIRFQKH